MKVTRVSHREVGFQPIEEFRNGTLVEDKFGTVYLTSTRDLNYILPLKAGPGLSSTIIESDRYKLAPANELFRRFAGVLELENE